MDEFLTARALKDFEASVTNGQLKDGLTFEKYMESTVADTRAGGAEARKEAAQYDGPDYDGPSKGKDFQL